MPSTPLFFERNLLVIFLIAIPILVSASASSNTAILATPFQEQTTDLISVFVDCPQCDIHYIRENITFVNYVRDKELADVHLLVVPHYAGASGTNYIISFVGYNQFDGMNNSLIYWAPGTNSWDDTRRGLNGILKLGLAPYVAHTGLANQISVTFNGVRQVERQIEEDPWDSWVFEAYGGANFRKEETQSSFNARYGVWADRITDDYKLRFRPYFNHNNRHFISNDEEIHSISHRHGFDSHVIKSLDDHWSTGLFFYLYSSTYDNTKFRYDLSPALQYSLFPYAEASSRAITFTYRIGYAYNNYYEETIFDKTSESLLRQSFNISVRYQQTWGSIRGGLTGAHYFHDFTANRAEFWARINLRLFSGFSLSIDGNLDLTNDLVSLPKGEMSLEDILLQQRRQASSYNLYGAVGLSYTFGSKFSNVVNTRL